MCPWRSFTGLKRSRSTISTASEVWWRAARLITDCMASCSAARLSRPVSRSLAARRWMRSSACSSDPRERASPLARRRQSSAPTPSEKASIAADSR
jgi:hypothetical protein